MGKFCEVHRCYCFAVRTSGERFVCKVQPAAVYKMFKSPLAVKLLGAYVVLSGSKRKKKVIGSLPRNVKVKYGPFTEERKGLTTSSVGNLKLDILQLDTGCSFLK